jgi:hypothetical protein
MKYEIGYPYGKEFPLDMRRGTYTVKQITNGYSHTFLIIRRDLTVSYCGEVQSSSNSTDAPDSQVETVVGHLKNPYIPSNTGGFSVFFIRRKRLIRR